jgi:uncharacterized coiled-coil DUF342 family protein
MIGVWERRRKKKMDHRRKKIESPSGTTSTKTSIDHLKVKQSEYRSKLDKLSNQKEDIDKALEEINKGNVVRNDKNEVLDKDYLTRKSASLGRDIQKLSPYVKDLAVSYTKKHEDNRQSRNPTRPENKYNPTLDHVSEGSDSSSSERNK